MRFASKLAGCAAIALIAASSGTAFADPPGGTTPRAGDVVGVGSDTIGYLLDQLSYDYDKTHPKSAPLLYSWDPGSGRITTKAACGPIARPGGSAAAVAALKASKTDPADHGDFCVDYAGSSSAPAPGSKPCASAGLCYIQLAGDAVTWASRDRASGGSDAPASLTVTQLKDIYLCKTTNWASVGGRHAPIRAFLPRTSSGTRTSWLTALGGGAPIKPGACVRDDGNTLADNQGVSPVLDSPEAIVPYSVADYIAQAYHDAKCVRASCTGTPACHPAATQNRFGCDRNGVLRINEIGGSRPALPWPLPNSACKKCAINPKFSRPFLRIVFIVVRYAKTPDHIPAYLEPFFAADGSTLHGWDCSSPTALTDIKNSGFLPLSGTKGPNEPAATGTQCGTPYH